MIAAVDKRVVVASAVIAAIRLTAFSLGVVLTTRFGDWRQVAGYPLLLVSALPDALLVRLVVSPRSASWPLVVAASILVTSAMLGMFLRSLMQPRK
jgi:hypothetical protein